MKQTVLGFPRTIYDFGRAANGFLDPWSSLKPSVLQRKIAPEILGIFSQEKHRLIFQSFFTIKDKFVDSDQLEDRWSLVFPKRTYLPPDYPHLQLWLINKKYSPSLKFMDDNHIKSLASATLALIRTFRSYSLKNNLRGKVAFGFNSTPFSFIKDPLGRYYAGGQSVRVYHVHYLLIPPAKKLSVRKEDLSLIYPTEFSHLLLESLFRQEEIKKKIGLLPSQKTEEKERGIEITWFPVTIKGLEKLWQVIRKIDKLLYRIQAILAFSFYYDTEKFIKKIEAFSKAKDISRVEKTLQHLIVVGKERPFVDTVRILKDKLRQFNISSVDVDRLTEKLSFNEEKDLCSFVFGQKVVLRPGWGYAMLLEEEKRGIRLKINPLDVLGPKGLIESSGYWFEKKIVKNEYPSWSAKMVIELVKTTKSE